MPLTARWQLATQGIIGDHPPSRSVAGRPQNRTRARYPRHVTTVVPIAEDVWTLEGGTIPFFAPPLPVRFTYAVRSVVIRLADGSLFVDSPVAMDDEVRRALEELGPVAHVVSPNELHHLFMAEWKRAFPEAKLWASPGLPEKRADLVFAGVLGDEPRSEWAGSMDQLLFRGSWFMEEVVFFHRPSRTLVLGDLVENHEPEVLGPVQRFWAARNAMLAPHGSTPRNFRLSFLRRDRARESLARMLAWEPERVLLMHGRCVTEDATSFLRRAFGWLA